MSSRLDFAMGDWKTLSVNPAENGYTFFELGKDKAAKGEGWAPSFIRCAQDIVGLEHPLPLRLIGYGKPLPVPLSRM